MIVRSGEGFPEGAPPGTEDDIDLEAVAPGFSKELRRLLLLLAAAATVFALLYFTPAGAVLRDIRHLRAHLAGGDPWAEATYALVVTALVALGLPRLMFYVLGGLVFGFWQGLILAQFGALAGSYLTFLAVRGGGRGWLMKRFGNHRIVGKAFKVRSSVKAVALIRQLPLSSVMITSGLALSQVSARVFFLGSFIGYLPQGVIAALIGSGVVDEKAMDGIGKLAAAGAALLLGAFLLWRWRNRGAGASEP
ncbi:MAG TPA: VTT domain-containing protein [Candidatus Desulfobacillus sp.]|nr:VTT domain-containing protein [Candidatus Desulfobacillus sp.]